MCPRSSQQLLKVRRALINTVIVCDNCGSKNVKYVGSVVVPTPLVRELEVEVVEIYKCEDCGVEFRVP